MMTVGVGGDAADNSCDDDDDDDDRHRYIDILPVTFCWRPYPRAGDT